MSSVRESQYRQFRHILENFPLFGFGSPQLSILQSVKELIENSIDACLMNTEGKILISFSLISEEKFIVLEVSDNGFGMTNPKEHLTCFATTKSSGNQFGSDNISMLKQTGKFGVGLSACLLYSILNTLRPMRIVSKVSNTVSSIIADFSFNFTKAEPEVLQRNEILMSNANSQLSGTKIKLHLQWIEEEADILQSKY